jgi:hypothetical protein
MDRVRIPLALLALSCAQIAYSPCVFAGPHDALISKHAATYGVPEALVRRVIRIESGGNARVVSKGNYGLMQIRLGTARAMGYRGTEAGLLDADTNMTYAVKYLAGAYRTAGCNESRAISYYQRGYYGAPRAKCPGPPQSAIQIAERRDETAKPAVAKVRPTATVPALAASSSVLVQMRPKPASEITGSVKAPPPAALTLKDALAQPTAMSVREPAAKPIAALALEAIRLPRGRPANTPHAVAALEPATVPMPVAKPEIVSAQEKQAERFHGTAHKRVRSGRRAAAEPSLITTLKRFFAPDRKSSHSRVTRQ